MLTDSFRANLFVDIPLPKVIPDYVYDNMGAIFDEFIFFSEGTDEGKNLGSSVFLETVSNNLNSFLEASSTTKFYFYSAHDTTVAAILAGLRAPVRHV
jgi:hypothetical protein